MTIQPGRLPYSTYFGNDLCTTHCTIVHEGKYFDVCQKDCRGGSSFYAVQDKSGGAIQHYDNRDKAIQDADKRNTNTGRVDSSIKPASDLEAERIAIEERIERTRIEHEESEKVRLEEIHKEQWERFRNSDTVPPEELIRWYDVRAEEHGAEPFDKASRKNPYPYSKKEKKVEVFEFDEPKMPENEKEYLQRQTEFMKSGNKKQAIELKKIWDSKTK